MNVREISITSNSTHLFVEISRAIEKNWLAASISNHTSIDLKISIQKNKKLKRFVGKHSTHNSYIMMLAQTYNVQVYWFKLRKRNAFDFNGVWFISF